MPENSKVLVIGGEMFLGQLLRDRLPAYGYRVEAIDDRDLTASEGGIRQVGPLWDRDLLNSACAGVGAVIDLSKLDPGRWDDGDIARLSEGAASFWAAARHCGVKRVITVHSDSVVGFYRRSVVLDHLSPPRPDGPTGIYGALNEAMASLYAFKYGISAFCVRMGACRPEPTDERMLSNWISPADFIQLMRVGLSADYTCEIVYGVSRNTDGWWDNSNARRLGYRPADCSDQFADRLRGQRSGNIIENVFQGGPNAASDFSGDIRRIP